MKINNDTNPSILGNKEGCMLPVQYRPCQGLLQVPRDDEGFILHTIMYPNYKCEIDYKLFQNSLKTLAYEYSKKMIPIPESDIKEQVNGLIRNITKKNKMIY